jgi:hypothetical protein
MRDSLGVLLMEEADGVIAVQLFADPVDGLARFDNYIGTEGRLQRARYLSIVGGKVEMKTKDLPVKDESTGAFRLGEGWVKIEKDKKP